MSWADFKDYVESKKSANGDIKLEYPEISELFGRKPTHTKNYEEKLFAYDSHSLVTTAGSAAINGKKIEELIEELILANGTDPLHEARDVEARVIAFCEFFSRQVANHVNTNGKLLEPPLFIPITIRTVTRRLFIKSPFLQPAKGN